MGIAILQGKSGGTSSQIDVGQVYENVFFDEQIEKGSLVSLSYSSTGLTASSNSLTESYPITNPLLNYLSEVTFARSKNGEKIIVPTSNVRTTSADPYYIYEKQLDGSYSRANVTGLNVSNNNSSSNILISMGGNDDLSEITLIERRGSGSSFTLFALRYLNDTENPSNYNLTSATQILTSGNSALSSTDLITVKYSSNNRVIIGNTLNKPLVFQNGVQLLTEDSSVYAGNTRGYSDISSDGSTVVIGSNYSGGNSNRYLVYHYSNNSYRKITYRTSGDSETHNATLNGDGSKMYLLGATGATSNAEYFLTCFTINKVNNTMDIAFRTSLSNLLPLSTSTSASYYGYQFKVSDNDEFLYFLGYVLKLNEGEIEIILNTNDFETSDKRISFITNGFSKLVFPSAIVESSNSRIPNIYELSSNTTRARKSNGRYLDSSNYILFKGLGISETGGIGEGNKVRLLWEV